MSLKNIIGLVLTLLILLLIYSGFTAFRVSNQMITPAPAGDPSRLGPVQDSRLPFGDDYHNCQGRLMFNRKADMRARNPVITLLDNTGADLSRIKVDDPANPNFWVRVPEGNQGLVRLEADDAYPIQTLIEKNVLVSLHEAATFSGTILGHVFVLQGEKLPDPTPLPKARLLIETAKGWQSEVTTDGTGKFEALIPPGPFFVTVRSDSHADAFFDNLTAIAGETIDRQIILPAGCELEGFAIGNNVTLEGARASLVSIMEDDADAVAGERGKFKITGLTSGMATLYLQHPGYQEESFNLLVPKDKIGIRKPFPLKPSENFNVSVNLGNSSNLPDALVRVTRGMEVIFEGPTAEFNEMNILASGQTYTFLASWNPAPEDEQAILYSIPKIWTMPESGSGELTLQIDDCVYARGLVLSAGGGTTFGGAFVKIRLADAQFANALEEITVWCDTSGRFESPPLPQGNYTVVAHHPFHGMVGKNVRLNQAGNADLGVFTLPE